MARNDLAEAVTANLAGYDQTRPESLHRQVTKLIACTKAARRNREHCITAEEFERADQLLAKLHNQWKQLRAEIAAAEETDAPELRKAA